MNLFTTQGATVRKRWTGLATTVAMMASLLALNGTIGAKADGPSGETWTLFAAGDIAKCDTGADEQNAAIIKRVMDADPDHTRVLMLGDGAYPDGSPQTYLDCYDKTQGANDGWGQFKNKTFPVPGNHDYGQKMSATDGGYRTYWNDVLTALNGDHGATSGDTLT